MPFNHKSNNRVLPANSRAVDVAKRTIQDIIPVQQRRYQNAFEVQGYETIVYQRLWHGMACSCQGARSVNAGYLNEDGKLAPGTMDQILSGGLEFEVKRYGGRTPTRSDLREKPSHFDDGQLMDGDEFTSNPAFDIVSADPADIFATTVTDEDMVGANGPSTARTLDEDGSEVFDGESYVNDTKCGLCFGSGFIGGFAVLNGQRIVLHTSSRNMTACNGTIETSRKPHAFWVNSVEFDVLLPKGAVSLDTFRLWNNDVAVYPTGLMVDGLPYSPELLLALCDGREHAISISFDEMSYFTHAEIQFNLSRKPALFELPRMGQNSNLSLQDATDDISINVGPSIPHLKREDVLVEATFGKALIVESVNPWNDKARNILGWDVQTRVLQPGELLSLLPRRLLQDQKTVWLVRDNSHGIRRT